MVDAASIAALVIATVALLIAAAQLTQQILATAYVLRKCDRIVTGGLVAGGKRKWYWRQFRFTVKYQSLVMALPESIYSSLGMTSTVKVEQSPAARRTAISLLEKARKSSGRHVSEQGCWVSLVQDLATSECLGNDALYIREESGDRIPDDMTIAPTQADALTVLLTCVAMGMQVTKYAPTAGEVFLAGPGGSISSSLHPVLGGLIHYSAFSNHLNVQDSFKWNGRALCTRGGVWANAVFGRFRVQSRRQEFVQFTLLRKQFEVILLGNGWPKDSFNDTIGGAACFMAFAHVDVCKSGAPSPIRPWCAHFAELIVLAHLRDVYSRLKDEKETSLELSSEYLTLRESFTERCGCSSRYLPWHELSLAAERKDHGRQSLKDSELTSRNHIRSQSLLQLPSLVFEWIQLSLVTDPQDNFASIDPSTYVKAPDAWEIVIRTDECMSSIMKEVPNIRHLADRSTAFAISNLAETGPPSWKTEAFKREIDAWPRRIPEACERVLGDLPPDTDEETHAKLMEWLPRYTELNILRAAYFTIMMRAAHDIGPGLSEDSRIDTALLYMA